MPTLCIVDLISQSINLRLFYWLQLGIVCIFFIKSSITVCQNQHISFLDTSLESNCFYLGIVARCFPHQHLNGFTGKDRLSKSSFNRLESSTVIATKMLYDGMTTFTVGTETVQDRLRKANSRCQVNIGMQRIEITIYIWLFPCGWPRSCNDSTLINGIKVLDLVMKHDAEVDGIRFSSPK